MRSDVGELLEMSELPTQTDGRRQAENLGDAEGRNAVAADRNPSGASEAMAKE